MKIINVQIINLHMQGDVHLWMTCIVTSMLPCQACPSRFPGEFPNPTGHRGGFTGKGQTLKDQQEAKRKALLLPHTPSSSTERDGRAQVICYFAFFIGQVLKKSCQAWDRQLPRTWIAQDPWGVLIPPVGCESWGKPSVPPHAEWMAVRYSLTWVIAQGHLQTVLLIAQQLSGGEQWCWPSQA